MGKHTLELTDKELEFIDSALGALYSDDDLSYFEHCPKEREEDQIDVFNALASRVHSMRFPEESTTAPVESDAVLIVFEDGTGEYFSTSDKFMEYLTDEMCLDQDTAEWIIEEKPDCYEYITTIEWDYRGYL